MAKLKKKLQQIPTLAPHPPESERNKGCDEFSDTRRLWALCPPGACAVVVSGLQDEQAYPLVLVSKRTGLKIGRVELPSRRARPWKQIRMIYIPFACSSRYTRGQRDENPSFSALQATIYY
jgi:hypothetical protein